MPMLKIHPRGFEDGVCHLIGCEGIGADRNVRHAIEGQATLIASGEVDQRGQQERDACSRFRRNGRVSCRVPPRDVRAEYRER